MKSGTLVLELDRRDRAARTVLMIGIAIVHLALLAGLFGRQAPSGNNRTDVAVVGLLSGLDPGEPAKKAVKARPTPEKLHPIIQPAPLRSLALPTMTADSAAPAISGAAGGCALTDQLRAAILADPASMAELASLPPDVRTDADAVMLWNGQWFDAGPQSGAGAIPPLRELVEKLVATAPAECREMTWTGPQFIAIAQGQRFTMLVVGSGQWRWRDLLGSSASCGVGDMPECPKASQTSGEPIN